MLPESINITSTKVLGTGLTEVEYTDQTGAKYTAQFPDDSDFKSLILGV